MDLFGEEPVIEEKIIEAEADAPPAQTTYAQESRTAENLYGHEEIERLLLEQFNSGRMPHALIFAGPSGVGKATMAYRLARFLLKNPPADSNQNSMFGDAPAKAESLYVSENDQVFRRVASGAHPDLLSIRREYDEAKNKFKNSVAVEDIRKVAPFLRMTSSEGGWRVVVVDDADAMTASSQNALLKILEEPPANTVLILVAHRLGAMIPTIRSRARVLHFSALDENAMHRLLQTQGHMLDEEQAQALLYLAGGSFGRALQLIEEGGLDVLQQVLDALEQYPNWDWVKIHAMADNLSGFGRDQSFAAFADIMPWVASQLTLAKARGQKSAPRPLNGAGLAKIMQNSSLERLVKICETLQEHFAAVQYANLDKKQGVIGAFSLLGDA